MDNAKETLANPCHEEIDSLLASLREVDALRVSMRDRSRHPEACQTVVEEHITLMIDDVGNYTLMCTPCDMRALAVGFLFTERLITRLADISLLAHCESVPNTIRVRLTNPPAAADAGRNLIVTSACGMCGTRSIADILAELTPVPEDFLMREDHLITTVAGMSSHQQLFQQTGGTHGAGIFHADGRVIAFAEDIGRHNALDKAIGKCLLTGTPMRACGVMLSGRVSLELVLKAAAAGIEFIAAVSAPSTLAVAAAEQCHITLCGFVRADRATIYSAPERILSTTRSIGSEKEKESV